MYKNVIFFHFLSFLSKFFKGYNSRCPPRVGPPFPGLKDRGTYGLGRWAPGVVAPEEF